jgi:hypothetical protein
MWVDSILNIAEVRGTIIVKNFYETHARLRDSNTSPRVIFVVKEE